MSNWLQQESSYSPSVQHRAGCVVADRIGNHRWYPAARQGATAHASTSRVVLVARAPWSMRTSAQAKHPAYAVLRISLLRRAPNNPFQAVPGGVDSSAWSAERAKGEHLNEMAAQTNARSSPRGLSARGASVRGIISLGADARTVSICEKRAVDRGRSSSVDLGEGNRPWRRHETCAR